MAYHPSWARDSGHRPTFAAGRPPDWVPPHLSGRQPSAVARGGPDPNEEQQQQPVVSEYDETSEVDEGACPGLLGPSRAAEAAPEADDNQQSDVESAYSTGPPPLEDTGAVRQHVCTDVPWLLLLLLGLGTAAWVVLRHMHLDTIKANIGKFYPPVTDYQGRECNREKGEALFFCKVPTRGGGSGASRLLLEYGICVETCPISSKTVSQCYDPDLKIPQNIPDYPTYTACRFGYPAEPSDYHRTNLFCLPQENRDLRHAALDYLGAHSIGGIVAGVVHACIKGWSVLLISMTWSILIGYVFLFSIDHSGCAEILVQVCIATMIVMPFYFGIRVAKEALLNRGWESAEYGSGNQQQDAAGACILFAASFATMCIACCYCSGMKAAVGCIEAAAECLLAEKSLLFEPAVGVTSKLLVLGVWGCGMIMLISNGVCSDGNVPGFKPSSEELAAMGAWTFLALLLLEIVHSMSEYVLAFAAQAWYHNENDKKFVEHHQPWRGGIFFAYWTAIRYHLGSILMGTTVVVICRLPRFLAKQLRVKDPEGRAQEEGPPCAACMNCCCGGFGSLYDDYLAKISKNAYMDIAMRSKPFWAAAERAQEVEGSQKNAVQALKAARFLFIIAGMGIIVWSTTLATYLTCMKVPYFSDPKSQGYIREWKPMVVTAFCMSFFIGGNFIAVLDSVGDALFYILAVKQEQWRKEHEIEAQMGMGLEHVKQTMEEQQGLLEWASCLFRQTAQVEEDRMEKSFWTPKKLRGILARMREEEEKGRRNKKKSRHAAS